VGRWTAGCFKGGGGCGDAGREGDGVTVGDGGSEAERGGGAGDVGRETAREDARERKRGW
jgi:hypothetical protein